MLLLDNLSRLRIDRGFQRHQLATITGIDVARIRDFETGQRRREPWLNEAVLLYRALGLTGIMPMINGQDVLTLSDGLDLDTFLPTDVPLFRAGVKMPLSLACRVTIKLGLSDPAQLVGEEPTHAQIWEILERNERGAPAGFCPWCLAHRAAGEEHNQMCLPNNYWAPRTPLAGMPDIPKPRPQVKGKRMGSGKGIGLKRERERVGWTQAHLGGLIGISASYMARVERGECALTKLNAEKIALQLGCSIEDLYHSASV